MTPSVLNDLTEQRIVGSTGDDVIVFVDFGGSSRSGPTGGRVLTQPTGSRWLVLCHCEKGNDSEPIDATWIFQAYGSSDSMGSEHLAPTIDGVNALIRVEAFERLDKVLLDCPSSAGRHVLLGLARATFPVRSRLTSWSAFVRKVETAFVERDLDAKSLLRGLAI